MKREILCSGCKQNFLHTLGIKHTMVDHLEAFLKFNEEVYVVSGFLHGGRSCRCDSCNAPLITYDEKVYCVSIVGMGQQYFEWEDEYIQRLDKHGRFVKKPETTNETKS